MAINCERCKKPVKLHQSLLNMNQSNYDLVLSTLSTLPEESTFDFSSFQVDPIAPSTSDSTKQNSRAESPTPSASTSTSEQETPKLNRRKSLLQSQSKFLNPADSFVFLSNSQILPNSLTTSAFAPSYPSALAKMAQESSKTNNNMSDRLKNLSRIFDLLNSEQQFDQPMCQDCTELLLEVLHKKLAGFSTERDVYQAYVKQIDQEVNGQTKPSKVTTKDIEKLEAEKEAVLVTLNEFEAQLKQLEEEREELERESAELDQLEEEYWRDYNEYELQCQAFEDEKESANRSYEASLQELELLHRTNVFNDTFHISYDGPFGMINGLRLGRLPSQQTDWAEINAAWGQTLLVLFLVANKLDFNFHTYKLIPRGSYSKIEKIDDDNTAYELYYTPDLSFGKLFMNRRFDHAMVAYLDCLQQLADHIEGRDPNIKLPYRVNKDKIAGLSVRLQFNSEETWTKALRLTLIDTKWALAFASDDKRK